MSLRSFCKSIVLALLCSFSSGLLADNASHINFSFNNPNDFLAPEPSCSSDLCSALLSEIQSAKKSIDFAIYGMRGQKAIFNALLAAKDRGVKLRAIVDKDTDNKNYYPDTDKLIKALGNSKRSDYESDKAYKTPKLKYKTWCKKPEGAEGPLSCSGFDLGDSCILTAQASKKIFGSK